MAQFVSLITIIVVGYTVTMFFVGASSVVEERVTPEDLLFVVLIPALNEEVVIGKSIRRLLSIPRNDFAVMVIDDGSTDATSEIVSSFESDRVWLYRRDLPEAQLGKGEALNAAYRYLRNRVIDSGRNPDSVIVVVLDADGRLDSRAFEEVAPYFGDPDRAAVQIKVRIYNAPDSILARLQDIEFATFTDVFQRARSRFGSSGLGGNGQFARLTALMAIGDSPWSNCLTEDLELGIQFLLAGWKNDFCSTVAVHQQGVTSVRRLIRQRARWYQGHLQCLRLVRPILRSHLDRLPRMDLAIHLTNAVLMLALQGMSTVFLVATIQLFATHPSTAGHFLFDNMQWLVIYILGFGLAPLIALIYWREEPKFGFVRGVVFAHLYVLYSYMWFAAGLYGLFRSIVGRTSWAKTSRTVGTGDEPVAVGAYQPVSV